MPYTLVSAPVLAFDVARLPRGDRVAVVLRHALLAPPEVRTALAEAVQPGRERARAALDEALRGRAAGLDAAADQLRGGDLDAALRVLERAPVGSPAALERFVADELMERVWQRSGDVALRSEEDATAAAVLVDAALAEWDDAVVPPALHDRLRAPYVEVTAGGEPDGPALHPRAEAALARLARATPADLAVLEVALEVHRPGVGLWSAAVHRASWAVHVAGREVEAADAQLRGVVLARRAGLKPAAAARGTWNLVAGALQALVVDDLLDDGSRDVLLAGWTAAMGPLPA